jgi:predicted RNase H-like HicB family nuclease
MDTSQRVARITLKTMGAYGSIMGRTGWQKFETYPDWGATGVSRFADFALPFLELAGSSARYNHIDAVEVNRRRANKQESMPGRVKIPVVEKPTPHGVYEILAQWDREAGVWVAESEDVPGLVAEADSPNVLAQKLRTLIPELLELNGVPSDRTARFHVRYQHEDSDVLAL